MTSGDDQQKAGKESRRSRTVRKVRVRALRPLLFLLLPLSLISAQGQCSIDWLNEVLEGVGYVMIITGVAVRFWSSMYVANRKSKTLVSSGPYSICRNPLYLGSIIIAVGTAVAFVNIFIGIYVLLLVLPMHLYVIAGEERHLGDIFGEAYQAYRRRTPRLWPKLSLYNSPEELTIPVRSLRRAAIDGLGFAMLPLLVEAVKYLQQTGLLRPILRPEMLCRLFHG